MELGARDVKRKVQSCVGNFLWGLATGGMTRADLLDATVTLRLSTKVLKGVPAGRAWRRHSFSDTRLAAFQP